MAAARAGAARARAVLGLARKIARKRHENNTWAVSETETMPWRVRGYPCRRRGEVLLEGVNWWRQG